MASILSLICSVAFDVLPDNAAWTTLANYVEAPSEQFIQESIGPHAFVSALIDSAIIFSPSGELIWYSSERYEMNLFSSLNLLQASIFESYHAPIPARRL
ncbi:CHASE4 domain-containing protein [Vibrio brasiliensis]